MFELSVEAYKRIGAPDYILDWVQNGVKFKFRRTPNQCFYYNRIHGAKQSHFMDQQVAELVRTNAVKQVNFKPKCVLSMQCVPKKQNKLRLVMDCRPINEDMEVPSFSQEGIKTVAEMIEAEDEMITIDLESGFHHVKVHESCQQFLGFHWRNVYYIWKKLPFGAKCAPYFFNKILQPVMWFLRENHVRITPFVMIL